MDVNKLIEIRLRELRSERERTQMTLGKLIDTLLQMPYGKSLSMCLSKPHCYRGYYEDLAFEGAEGITRVSKLLSMCFDMWGETFIGYKGGEYVMDRSTPIWIADWGNTGQKLIAVHADGRIETAEDD